ncbi:MAG TPA: hypothetical protein VGN81_08250 [Pseudonocardiaceae bacterium]|jgi:hypothetical protein
MTITTLPDLGRTRHSAVKRERWSTPRKLVVLGSLAVLLTAILGIVIASAASTESSEVDLLGSRTAPQVTVTTDLSFALSDLDAEAANALLVGNGPAMADARSNALSGYEQRRTQVDADLQQAAIDASTDPDSEKEIGATINAAGQYESLISQALLVSQQGGDLAGQPSAATIELYRQATNVIDVSLDNITQLVISTQGNFNDTYDQDSADSVTAQIWIGLLGGVLILVLIVIQIQLRLRQRRRLNPALLAGTVIALLVTILSTTALGGEAGNLHAAKQDAFDSIVALSQARATSYSANGDESRYLLDHDGASDDEQAFLTNLDALAGIEAADLPSYQTNLASTLQVYQQDHRTIDFEGYFATELRNITFPGEQQAADQVLAAYQTYLAADQHLRALATSGDRTGAIQFDIGVTPGNSDADFNAYDKALVNLIQINQGAFTADIGAAQSELSGWSLTIPLITALLVIGLLTLGLRPRIAEYR